MKIKIGMLYDKVCSYLNINGEYEKEIYIKDLGMTIPCDNGMTNINYIIKKKSEGLHIFFDDNTDIICAKHHILYKDNKDIYACDLMINDAIDGYNNIKKRIIDIQESNVTDYYDISVDYPHIYYDDNDIKHHNTLISAVLLNELNKFGNALIIVPSKDLCTQSADEYKKMGLDTGIVGCGLREFGHKITVCTWQTIHSIEHRKNEDTLSYEELNKMKENLIGIIFDEAHTAKGNEIKKVMESTFKDIPIRWGLTGTVNKDKSERMCLITSLGPIADEKVSSKELQDKGFISSCNVNCIRLKDDMKFMEYSDEAEYLAFNENRLTFISLLIANIVKNNNNTLVLIGRIKTGDILEKKLLELGVDAIFLNGSVKSKKRFEEYDSIKTNNNRCLICTDKIASTGLNIPRLYNLVFLDFGKSFTKTIQSIGRGLRKAKDKDHVDIFDISSTIKYSKKHFNERIKYYEEAQFPYKITEIDNWK